MVIQDQVNRLWWRMLAYGVVIDLVIAAGLAWIFAEEDDRLVAAAIIWLILQVVSILMSLRYVLHASIAWKFGQAEIVEDAFLAELRRSKLPAPNQFESSVESYLGAIIEDTGQSAEKRIAAASLGGMKVAFNQSLGVVRGIMIKGAHERALKRYSEHQTS